MSFSNCPCIVPEFLITFITQQHNITHTNKLLCNALIENSLSHYTSFAAKHCSNTSIIIHMWPEL